MRRFVSIFTMSVLLISLVGCGSSTSTNTESAGNTSDGGASVDTGSYEFTSCYDNFSYVVPDGATSSKDTLVICIPDEEGGFDDVYSIYASTSLTYYNIFGAGLLVEAMDEEGNIDFICNRYTLTDSCEVAEDGLGATFHFKDNIIFHNGEELTMEDVYYSMNLYSEMSRFNFIDFDNIEVVDDRTVFMPFTYFNTGWSSSVSRYMRIWEKDAHETAVADGTVSTDLAYNSDALAGPYIITEWDSGDHISGVADENWFGGTPLIENILIRFIPDTSVAMLELESGGVDFLWDPPANYVENYMSGDYGDSIKATSDPAQYLCAMIMNCASELKDENLRKAICHAIDWETIREGAFGVQGTDPVACLSSTFVDMDEIEGFTDWWKGYYDVDLAKEYMAKTQYANGGLSLTGITQSDEEKVAVFEIMSGYLKEIGIDLTIKQYDIATFEATMDTTEGWNLAIYDNGGTGKNHGISVTEGHSWMQFPHAMDADPEKAQELIDLGNLTSATVDEEEYRKLTVELNERFMNEDWLYWFPIAQENTFIMMRGNLNGLSRSNRFFFVADCWFE